MARSARTPRVSIEFLSVLLTLGILFTITGCSSPFQAPKGVTPRSKTATLQAPSKETKKTSEIPQVPKIIRTANVEIEVGKGEFQKKFDQAQAIAEQVGGFVSKSNASATKGELSSGTVTLRVPKDKFFNAINQVKKLGNVKKVETGAEDISEEYVDLQSRLKNYQAQEAALLQLMARSQSVQDTLSVQQSLASVQEQIEIITGRLNFLQNRVDYSTITVTIEEPGAVVPPSDEWGFLNALRTAARAFIGAINIIIIVLGALGPFIIIGVVVWYIIRVRRSKK